jgi:hypothetical protein
MKIAIETVQKTVIEEVNYLAVSFRHSKNGRNFEQIKSHLISFVCLALKERNMQKTIQLQSMNAKIKQDPLGQVSRLRRREELIFLKLSI